ncbi:hypothetical protein BaRGS_00002695 [Batillaria attramentaria]|uniref:Corrinoid adenosyltransferase MMAB n=1 Tax=Batillaria attramentaria TaxID=370345 RepID=A0ABD0M2R8_9CAEN
MATGGNNDNSSNNFINFSGVPYPGLNIRLADETLENRKMRAVRLLLGAARRSVVLTACPQLQVLPRHYSKIYTKTGDKGTSSTFTGARKAKDDKIFHALGSTDELSCLIGVAAEYCVEAKLDMEDKLTQIQCILQDVGSNVATPLSTARDAHLKKVVFNKNYVPQLEAWIDELTAQLPPLKNFILPSGGKCATHLHLARSVCRRAEREITALVREGEIDQETYRFMNRLSDYLFSAARFAAMKEGKEEMIYRRIE